MNALCKRLAQACLRSVWWQGKRGLSTQTHDAPQVAIVGSGPAGFYTAQQLIKGHPTLKVDMYEKLPVPFGLVRFGVAPDHPEVKNCINSFTQTAQGERFSFIGNVEVGRDITVGQLREAYTAVVFCHGASNDRQLGISGENLPNVLSARSFVGWYNGLPQDKELEVNLDCETAVVLGQGNVALDVARVLLMPVDILAKTDVSEYALEALSRSRIKRVELVGRRGPLQVAFTIKELREMITLPMCRTIIDPEDVESLEEKLKDLSRPRRRLMELLFTAGVNPPEKYTKIWADANRSWRLKFLRSPTEMLSSSDGRSLEGVKFTINQLQGDNFETQRAVPTGQTEVIPCGLVLRSIGYKGSPIDDTLPFDPQQGVIPNTNGRVNGCKGLYCSGWISRGPVFVILGTMSDGFSTGKAVLADLQSGLLSGTSGGGKEAVFSLLKQRDVRPVTFSEWEKIDKEEISRGQKKGKPREKIASVEQLLQTAWS
ncbi:NADPH:adrenodoxin oxidoreductase, mitochondrial-like [Babylonia areolata]|uniref:NADPH:adrenodoxin oxidoreductase, mitochondrial-like n=1 Tax=Babylonia areolata TaxID=304850 RepID=UPI003FD20532